MGECEKWLLEYLSPRGEVICNAVRDEARKQGYARGQLKAARKSLGVRCCNDWAANGEALNWFWSLPGEGVTEK